MTRKTEALLWVDIETTGTDPRTDLMLEIGLRCTSMDANTEYGRYESIIKPDILPTDQSFAYAHRMHEANGLINEVIDASPELCSTERVALAVIDFTQSMAETHVLHPAGTNMMGFDLPFLEHYLFAEDQWGRFHKLLSLQGVGHDRHPVDPNRVGSRPVRALHGAENTSRQGLPGHGHQRIRRMAGTGQMSRTNPTRETHRLTARRDHYRCLRCGNELDHIWSGHSLHHRHMRSHPFPGLHLPANLIHLCGSGTTGCHGWVHNHPKTAMEYGWIVSMGEDHPENIPVWDAHQGWLLLDNQGGYTLCDRDGNPR